jgi:hypothetical protein
VTPDTIHAIESCCSFVVFVCFLLVAPLKSQLANRPKHVDPNRIANQVTCAVLCPLTFKQSFDCYTPFYLGWNVCDHPHPHIWSPSCCFGQTPLELGHSASLGPRMAFAKGSIRWCAYAVACSLPHLGAWSGYARALMFFAEPIPLF